MLLLCSGKGVRKVDLPVGNCGQREERAKQIHHLILCYHHGGHGTAGFGVLKQVGLALQTGQKLHEIRENRGICSQEGVLGNYGRNWNRFGG